jgi:hypothetical protein
MKTDPLFIPDSAAVFLDAAVELLGGKTCLLA